MAEVTKGLSYGGQNGLQFFCTETEQDASYGICQIFIDMVKDKLMIPASYEKCKEKVQEGICPAIAMQRKEKDAGHDLFFKPWRAPAIANNAVAPARSMANDKINLGFTPKDLSGDNAALKAPATKVPDMELSDAFSASPTYADAINATIKENIASAEADKKPLSLLERAKLMSKGKQ